jgi:hypothetical protein
MMTYLEDKTPQETPHGLPGTGRDKENDMQQKNDFWTTPIPVADAAEIAKISPRTIHRWIKRGWIKGYGAGRCTRVVMAEVLAERRIPQTRTAAQRSEAA